MISLTPSGHLVAASDPATDALPGLEEAFRRGAGPALLKLGGEHVGEVLPVVLAWWRDFAALYLNALCTLPDAQEHLPGRVPAPQAGELQQRIWSAPPMDGGEYLSAEVLERLWSDLDRAFHESLAESGKPLAAFLKALSPAWNLVGRLHVHLAENKTDPALPFAFLATYTTKLSAQGKAQHRPLGEALREYAAASDTPRLLALLDPLERAARNCPWLKDLLVRREIFQPLRWSPSEAFALLRDVPLLERAGVVVRMPAAWGARRPARPKVVATVGGKAPASMGAKQLLDVSLDVAIDGEPLTREEIDALLAQSEGLVLFRGKWIELDAASLDRTLERYREIERLASEQGLGFHEAMRFLAGVPENGRDGTGAAGTADWAEVVAGPWLAQALAGLRTPQTLAEVDPGSSLKAELRPYQQVGLRWLHFLSQLGFGACLADDMGLGKTIQVLALLLSRKKTEGPAPSLLVVPASLLSNWAQEAARFAPDLRVFVAHPSMQPPHALDGFGAAQVAGYDLVVVTYGSLHRLSWLSDVPWRLLILDEAQAIKNAGTRQTRAAKAIHASSRIALTGTPVENHLGDLWSIFDFLNPGLLGAAKPFGALVKRLEQSSEGYAPLRRLVQPYILRRLKTDRTVIDDLPDKTELTAYCGLSRHQAVLYQKSVEALAEGLADADGLARKGLVLAFLTRFKQICNHPSHWLKSEEWTESDSGKFVRLREIAEVAASKGEKLLVFSQFAEATGPLFAFLQEVMGRPGCLLTGSTPIKERRELVRRFQEDDTTPFFVLSLKAGGSGLNLTAASHVVHFDRWWNPAVENQATDRAFRIGQKRNVLVHKFVCRGTVEERIDELIAGKRQLAAQLLDDAQEVGLRLTEMSDEELLATVRLDINAATAEGTA